MQHPNITTHHIYHAPDAAIYMIRCLSDLCFEFGCGTAGYRQADLVQAGRRFLPSLTEAELLRSATEHRKVLEASILEELSVQQSHLIVTLHHRLDAGYGWRCLVSQHQVFEVSERLAIFGLGLPAAVQQASD